MNTHIKESDRAKTLSQADPSELSAELRARGYLVNEIEVEDFSVKGDLEAFFSHPEHEYTTTQRYVDYASNEDVELRPGKGPSIIHPARGDGLPWDLYETQQVVFTAAVGPVQQSKQVLWVWTWCRKSAEPVSAKLFGEDADLAETQLAAVRRSVSDTNIACKGPDILGSVSCRQARGFRTIRDLLSPPSPSAAPGDER